MKDEYVNFYMGSFGKCLLIRLFHEESLRNIINKFDELIMRGSSEVNPLNITQSSKTNINKIRCIVGDSSMICQEGGDWTWVQTMGDVTESLEKLRSLLRKERGHQYFECRNDDPVIKISYKEE